MKNNYKNTKQYQEYSCNLYENMLDKHCFLLSKDNEVAIMKKIDIKHLQFVKNLIKKYKLKLRIRYRGQSTDTYKRNPSYVLMNNATSFAIYER